MKSLFYAACTGLLMFFILPGVVSGQTTITTSGYSSYWYGTHTSAVGITFIVRNTNSHPIALTAVGYRPYSSDPAELWYSATSLTGVTGLIGSTSSNWTSIATVPAPTASGTIINNFFSGFNLIIPANTSYRFAVVTNNNVFFGSNPITLGPYSASGVQLDTDNAMWGAANPGLNGPGYNFYGSITFSPCAYAPTGLSANNITSTTADLAWNPMSTGTSVGFDYIVSTSSTPPTNGYLTGTNTTYNATGLTPATTYYLHVRNKCSGTTSSAWTTYTFETTPPCVAPALTISNVTSNSADINWTVLPHAVDYDCIVDQNPDNPTTTNSNTTGVYNATGLNEGEKYYVHVRMNCLGGEFSAWALDSFRTSIICRPPALTVDYINSDRAVIYWKPMPSAIKYEYEISKSPTPLGHGTAIETTSFLAFPMNDGETYYFHVRSQCIDQEYESISDWATTSFTTFPTSVNNLAGVEELKLYPNPVTDLLTVHFGNSKGEGTIIITDLSGRTLYTAEVNTPSATIDMAGFTTGLYILKYTNNAGNSVLHKIAKE